MSHRPIAALIRAILILTAAGCFVAASHAKPQPAPAILQDASKASTETVATVKTAEKKLSVDLGGGVTMDLVPIRPGSFMMGSNDGEAGEKPVHEVTLDFFWMGETEVTQAQYQAIMGMNLSGFKGADKPVEMVTWNDAMDFCKKLSVKTGKAFTLPTEAQWEYACRAGSSRKYCFGDSDNQLDDYAWYFVNSKLETHPVRQKKQNAWGLYDMHGNVAEWCFDLYGPYIAEKQTNPVGKSHDTIRVVRGSGWVGGTEQCRASYRGSYIPGGWGRFLGFRVACIPSK
ncbi:MAG: formylglycine-generating enzyme family protein [Candidatus Sumerlaeota bacterium]|nr:formylglycine-generating enzyme family protein [Candidatus Sumerlaeota bacterium]